jgi:aminoglycoside phosphotransferase (APT) family kinase protein
MAEEHDLDPGTPWRRDLGEVGPALERWAREKLGRDARVTDVSSPGNGMSSETVLFTMTADGATERYCARLAPMTDVFPVFPEYDIALQHRCMDLVRERTDVPVPEVRWVELDPQWIGTPFLVMVRIDGEAPPDIPPYVFGGWMYDATPEQRAVLQRSSIDVLARLHTINPANADLSFLSRPQHGASAMDQQLGHERWYYEWAREGVQYPLIERTFEWLDANRPEEGEAVLNWGDARIGNILYRDFEPVAVLDWEMATVGPREVDLAWMLVLHDFFMDLAARFEMPGIAGFMNRHEVIATYEELTGHRVRHLEWYEVFGALRFAIVSIRTSTRGIAYGQMEKPDDPDDLIMFRGMQERMVDSGTYWD